MDRKELTVPDIKDSSPTPPPRRGRKKVKDLRKGRHVLWNNREWSVVKARAEARGMGVGAYVRLRALEWDPAAAHILGIDDDEGR